MIPSAACVLALIASPLRALPAESLRLSADNLSASFAALAAQSRLALEAAKPSRVHRNHVVIRPEPLPENCLNLPVVSIRNGEIFKNGVSLGSNASGFLANCDGLVVWRSSYGELYRETQRVSSSVNQYDVAWHGDVIVWKDSSGELHRGNETLGRVDQFTFIKYTGDVVWKDGWGELYRNRENFGRAQSYGVASRTGDVAWVDSFGVLHRNDRELGRAQSWQIADRTGDVGWLDSFRNLYKNGVKVGDGVSQFSVREDGKLIWVDSWGNTHSA